MSLIRSQPHQPVNLSLAQPTKFQLSFSRLPELTYFLQSVNLPGVSATDVVRATPFVDLYLPGEKIVYDTLNTTFLVDEDLRNWCGVHDWMVGFTFPERYEQYRNMIKENGKNGQYSDATLTVHSNSNTPILRVKMKDCFPIQLASITYDSTQDANSPVVGDATFRFSYHTIERI